MFFVFCGAVFTANLFEDWKICFHCKPSWGAPRLTAVLGHHTGTWTTSICVALVRWRRMICKPKEFYKMLQLEKREILEYEILCAYGVESSVVQNVNVNWGFEPDELSTWVILGSRVQPSFIHSDSAFPNYSRTFSNHARSLPELPKIIHLGRFFEPTVFVTRPPPR